MEAVFTSLVGGEHLRGRILDLIAQASDLAKSRKVDLHVMMFAFTDEVVADALASAAASHSSIDVRILADWSQRIRVRHQQVGRLASLGLPNLCVRYKMDQPYLWDAVAARMRWSYHTSRGLLHHKTLNILVDGCPWKSLCGSFNWTGTAARSYENLLIVTAEQPEARHLLSRLELEFEALWSDGRATLSPSEAHLHYQEIINHYNRDPTVSPAEVVGLSQGEGELLQILDPDCYPAEAGGSKSKPCAEPQPTMNPPIAIAFNARHPGESRSQCGYANSNRMQRFFRYSYSGKSKQVPLTLTNLALDTIFRSASGSTLKIAMYGLSARVPEYGALLNAARRGVRLFVLLDGTVGSDVSARFTDARDAENLPIEVRTVRRMMHQKYIVNPNTSTVLTGTANMTTDASARHLEHRIRVSGDPHLAAQFCEDFDNIWGRLTGRPWLI